MKATLLVYTTEVVRQQAEIISALVQEISRMEGAISTLNKEVNRLTGELNCAVADLARADQPTS